MPIVSRPGPRLLVLLVLAACAPDARRPGSSAPSSPPAPAPQPIASVAPTSSGPVAREYVIDVVDQADLPRLRELARRYQEHSQWLWRLSEGQNWIGRLRIRDASRLRPDTTLLIPAGMLDRPQLSLERAAFVTGSPTRHVELTGLAPSSVVAHELGHFEWYLGEEYDQPVCPCVMALTAVIGHPGGFSAPYYCSDDPRPNHVPGAQAHLPDGAQGSCWTLLRRFHQPGWVFPNPAWDPASRPPPCQVQIDDA